MKNKFKITLAMILVCAIAFAVPILADTIFTDKGFSYTQLDGNYASICDWDGGSDTMRIPLMLNNSYVREIASWSFNGRDDFSNVDFTQADYLNAINSSAFKNCTGINDSLNIPAQVSSIGVSAFQGCSSLETLYYNTTADIPNQCFYLCTSLRDVTLTYGVQSIGRFAFASCENLEYVRIPETIAYIDSTAFLNCPNLVIYCYTDSYAHSFAEDNGIEYVLIDAPLPTEPATEPVTEPVTEATEATEPPTTHGEVSFILGDADNSGNVDIVDATFAQRYVTRSEIPAEILSGMDLRADIDSSGEVESTDVTFIMRHIIRLNVPYPVGELITV